MAVFFLYAGTQRVIIFVLFQQTPPKLLVLLFWDAKPYQMGLEKVSFSVGGGGLHYGGTLSMPFQTSRHQWAAREERA